MINFQFFPRSLGISKEMSSIVNCFHVANDKISSDKHDLVSNSVLAILRPDLEKNGFIVEKGKSKMLK